MKLQNVNEIIKSLNDQGLEKLKSILNEINEDELAIKNSIESGREPDEVAELVSIKEEKEEDLIDFLIESISNTNIVNHLKLKEDILDMKFKNREIFIKEVRNIQIN